MRLHVLVLLVLSNILRNGRHSWIEAIRLSCERDQKFIKVDNPDGLPLIIPLNVTSAAKGTFCMADCLNDDNCKSVVFNKATTENNCQFSGEENGATSNEPSTVTYIMTARLDAPCGGNPCQHDATCTDMCVPPFYHCQCVSQYFQGQECQVNNMCDTSPCQNGGTCSPSTSSPYYSCACSYPWAGAQCQDNTRCNDNPCVRGWCNTQNNAPHYHCNCESCWDGPECQHNQMCNWCNRCQNDAGCHHQDNHPYYHCSCTTLYGGYDCDSLLGIFG